ncbi:tRNA (adenosine(37)-N6)-threonylcarbamoyltransferase complex dimerization subunit type 1 TsaB [Streptococcaceae bacterium ESL0687]|nr:tRNA (adenosine(37)-N6)-threonylcarbamoyltransferase complex dimerization subunit type 1 TsaB [Streptococcaceae bacterium ESL0687]
MKILAFDTSSKALSVALIEDDKLLGQLSLNIKKNHSITLMPAIDFLLSQLDMKASNLDRIAVAEGPGSYTGLRIAVTTAKTLAYTLKCELVGISSLQAIAARLSFEKGLIVPLIDARRKNVYAGAYLKGESFIKDQHISLENLLDLLKDSQAEKITFMGEVDNFVEDIKEKLPQAEIIRDSELNLPSAYEVALLGAEKEAAEVHNFLPNYLKLVEAEEKWLENHDEKDKGYISKL